MELFHGARRPSEALFRVSEVAHNVAIFPATSPCAGAPQVGGGRGPVVHGAQAGGEGGGGGQVFDVQDEMRR